MTSTKLLDELIEQLPEVNRQLSEAARPSGQLSNSDLVQRKRFDDEILVRTYRPADRSVVRGLHRNVQGFGHAGIDCETVLNAMTDVAKPSRHHVWVAEAEGQVIAATAVARHRDQTAHLLWLRVAAGLEYERYVFERLVRTATAHVREHGCLKLVVHTLLAASQVADFLHHLGFTFSRERGVGGAHVLEFYLDLYMRPHLRESRF